MKRGNHSKSRGSKALVLALALVLIVGAAIGTTLAWLTDQTDPVQNTFTVGNIDIDLKESPDLDLKMIPGMEIAKDPKVTVYNGSEACWVFVKVEETTPAGPVTSADPNGSHYSFDQFITYTVDSAWTALDATNYPGVYYLEQAAIPEGAADAVHYVLTGSTAYPNGKVAVPANVTKQMMDDITNGTVPKLTVTAYAIQKAGFDTAKAAWDAYKTQNP